MRLGLRLTLKEKVNEAAHDEPHHDEPVTTPHPRSLLLNDDMRRGEHGDAAGRETRHEAQRRHGVGDIVDDLPLIGGIGMRQGIFDKGGYGVHFDDDCFRRGYESTSIGRRLQPGR